MAKQKKKIEVSDNPELIMAAVQEVGAHVTGDLGELAADKYLDTGIWGLNYAVSHGGIPSTYVVECHGDNGLGKTSLALHMAARAKLAGFTVYYVDVEMAVNDSLAGIFVGKDDINWIHPDTGEKALDIASLILKTTKNAFVVLDSVGAVMPQKVEDASAEDSFIGVHARMMSNFGGPAARHCKRNNNILFCLNHETTKITPMGARGYIVSGGRKWAYTADLRIHLTKRYPNPDIMDGDAKIGHILQAEITKNRHGAPYRKCELPLIYGQGFDTDRELIENAINFGVVKRAGAWYSYGEDKQQGLNAMSSWLKSEEGKRIEIVTELNELVM